MDSALPIGYKSLSKLIVYQLTVGVNDSICPDTGPFEAHQLHFLGHQNSEELKLIFEGSKVLP